MKANPGGRVPHRRALTDGFTIHIDTREKYPFRFAGRNVSTDRVAVAGGDYGVRRSDQWLAVVERKGIEDLISSLSTGTLAFQLARLAELPIAAVVVEGRRTSRHPGAVADSVPRDPDHVRGLAKVCRVPFSGDRAR